MVLATITALAITTDLATMAILTTTPITIPTTNPISQAPATTTMDREDTDITTTKIVEQRTAVPV